MPPQIGVLAIQGDFERHLISLQRSADALGQDVSFREVRTVAEMDVQGLIIPGGESTTVGLLLQHTGVGEEIRRRVESGLSVWGTCMGMIMMAREIVNRQQYSLDILDITVERNAFGRQVHSFEDTVQLESGESALGVFIRAPIVTRVGEGVEVMARYDGKVVAVQQGKLWATSFHPELTEDLTLHKKFIETTIM